MKVSLERTKPQQSSVINFPWRHVFIESCTLFSYQSGRTKAVQYRSMWNLLSGNSRRFWHTPTRPAGFVSDSIAPLSVYSTGVHDVQGGWLPNGRHGKLQVSVASGWVRLAWLGGIKTQHFRS